MKIIWYVNVIMPDAAKALGLKSTENGSWLLGQAPLLAEAGVDLYITNVTARVTKIETIKANGITYILIPSDCDTTAEFARIISDIKPDVVHVFGTEYRYNTDFLIYCATNNIPHVVSLQSVVYDYAKHYKDGLPENKFNRVNPVLRFMKKVFMADSIALGQQQFEIQGKEEIKALKLAKNVIGRTHWDKALALETNPDIRYFHVNENLRDAFYEDEKWSWDNCKKHTIVISQGFYPIKGFHQFLPALAKIKELYPDVKVYVCGQSPFTTHNKFLDYFVDFFFEYQKHIKQLIKKYNLADCIEYKGFMNAKQMKELFLSANVLVNPSTIENGCISVGEAMICGTPVVASSVGGVPTTLSFGRDGILYDFYDTDALVEGVKLFFDDRNAAEAYSEKSKAGASLIYDRHKNTQDMINAYKAILEEK